MEGTYNVFPRFRVLNMSGNRLTKFLAILLLFSHASATADLKAAGVLKSLKTFKLVDWALPSLQLADIASARLQKVAKRAPVFFLSALSHVAQCARDQCQWLPLWQVERIGSSIGCPTRLSLRFYLLFLPFARLLQILA